MQTNVMEYLLKSVEKYPDKDFIIDAPKGKPMDWKSIATCKAGLH